MTSAFSSTVWSKTFSKAETSPPFFRNRKISSFHVLRMFRTYSKLKSRMRSLLYSTSRIYCTLVTLHLVSPGLFFFVQILELSNFKFLKSIQFFKIYSNFQNSPVINNGYSPSTLSYQTMDVDGSGPAKGRKRKFVNTWENIDSCIKKVEDDPHLFQCRICRRKFTVTNKNMHTKFVTNGQKNIDSNIGCKSYLEMNINFNASFVMCRGVVFPGLKTLKSCFCR